LTAAYYLYRCINQLTLLLAQLFKPKELDISKQSENTEEESGVQPSDSEDDMKEYVEEVIQEIKGTKSGST
jgi:hypothetical protein